MDAEIDEVDRLWTRASPRRSLRPTHGHQGERTMKTTAPPLLTTAFYDLHRPVCAAVHLTPEEATVAVTCFIDLVAGHWTTVVNAPSPSA